MHKFCDNAVTGDILTSFEIDGTPLVPLIYMPGTSGIYFVRLPNRLCSSPPLLGFYWNRWGKTALPQALMPTIYKQHLYNMTSYMLFPVLGDNRTLRMRASRITRPDSRMRHIDTDRFLHDMAHITYHI